MADAGGRADVILLRASGPRVRFREEVRVRDFGDDADLSSCRADRLELLKGSPEKLDLSLLIRRTIPSQSLRPRKCALNDASPSHCSDAGQVDDQLLRAYLDTIPVDQDLSRPYVSLTLLPVQ